MKSHVDDLVSMASLPPSASWVIIRGASRLPVRFQKFASGAWSTLLSANINSTPKASKPLYFWVTYTKKDALGRLHLQFGGAGGI